MDWEGSEKVNVNVLKDNFVCRMSFLHNDFYRPSTWQGRHFFFVLKLFMIYNVMNQNSKENLKMLKN